MPCRYFLKGKELSRDELVAHLQSLPHEKKLALAPEIAADSKNRVSWTPGEAQAARYDLSKQLNSITVVKNGENKVWHPTDVHGRQLGSITVNPDGKIVKAAAEYGNTAVGKSIDEVFGKEVAEKGMSSTESETRLHAKDLKVGGEGMRGFYDQILPKVVEKLGKQYGVKVKQGTVSPDMLKTVESWLTDRYDLVGKGNGWQVIDKSSKKEIGPIHKTGDAATKWLYDNNYYKGPDTKVHYFDIPPKMKEDVLKKGFPLFSDSSVGAPISALENMPWKKNPDIGWWKDQGDHYTMYHGTNKTNVPAIADSGIKAPQSGPTAGKVSMTFDPYTAHGYASMGGESAFRAAGSSAKNIPHQDRRVVVTKIPKTWADEHMDKNLRGNVGNVKDNLKDKEKYQAAKKAGKSDHEYYATTELRFNKPIPKEFVKGVMQRVPDKQ